MEDLRRVPGGECECGELGQGLRVHEITPPTARTPRRGNLGGGRRFRGERAWSGTHRLYHHNHIGGSRKGIMKAGRGGGAGRLGGRKGPARCRTQSEGTRRGTAVIAVTEVENRGRIEPSRGGTLHVTGMRWVQVERSVRRVPGPRPWGRKCVAVGGAGGL